MASGMWTATSGAVTQSQNLDLIANNLANSDTPAYKKDVPTFKEYMANAERIHAPEDIPRGAVKDKDLYPLDGRDQSYVIMDGTHTDYRQGNLRVTQRQLDVALDGPGFLEVSTPDGIRFTRQGSLKIHADGKLVTNDGFPVLLAQPTGIANQPGAPNTLNNLPARFINLKGQKGNLTITDNGDLYAGQNNIGKLSVVEFRDFKKLKKHGGQLFENLEPTQQTPAVRTLVRQGVLETSNVNPVEEMANMIRTNRLFEEDLKALKTYGELLGKEANEVGKL